MAGLLKRLVVVLALAVLMFTATAVAAVHPAPAKKHGGDHPAPHHQSKALHKKHEARKHGGHGGHGHNKPHHRM